MRIEDHESSRIRCQYCWGDGTDHSPSTVKRDTCPNCGGTGRSGHSYDQPRNGTSIGVQFPSDYEVTPGSGTLDFKALLQKYAREQNPTLVDLRCLTEGRWDYHKTSTRVGVTVTWVNKDYAKHLEMDLQGKYYEKGYWDGVENSKPYDYTLTALPHQTVE